MSDAEQEAKAHLDRLEGTAELSRDDAEAIAFVVFKAAAGALRDAELAMRAASEAYRQALDALNRAVAPVPPMMS